MKNYETAIIELTDHYMRESESGRDLINMLTTLWHVTTKIHILIGGMRYEQGESLEDIKRKNREIWMDFAAQGVIAFDQLFDATLEEYKRHDQNTV